MPHTKRCARCRVRLPQLLASRRRPQRVDGRSRSGAGQGSPRSNTEPGRDCAPSPWPMLRLASRFHGVANVFAIAQRSFAQQAAIGRAHFHAVAGVGTCLLAADVELDGAVDGGRAGVRPLFRFFSTCAAARALAAGSCGACLNHAGSMYSSRPSRPPSRPYPLSRYPPKPQAASNRFVQFTHTTPALSCAATCSATLMFSLHTHDARP